MINILDQTPIAIVGGGRFCRLLLELLLSDQFSGHQPKILGVADPDDQAEGIQYAREKGIYTTDNHEALYRLKGLQVLIEVTNDATMAKSIEKTQPKKVKQIDQVKSRTLLSLLQIEAEKSRTLQSIQQGKMPKADMASVVNQFADNISQVIRTRCERYEMIERELVDSKQELDQIIEGNTIPTFVINQDHVVTHWNRACEKLTGYSADKLIGTRDQWKPFRLKKRPIMADFILDGIKEEDTLKYYGTKWHRSSLIDGAYEVEEFFPHLGEEGLWLFFTAAPIKTPDG